MPGRESFLHNIWYYALPSAALKAGDARAKTLLGEPILFCRDKDSNVFALRDICAHRSMPLSYGSFDGREVECRYHGWRYNASGICTHIPSLVGQQDVDAKKIRVPRYTVHEAQGCVWVFIEDSKTKADSPPVPHLPDVSEKQLPVICETLRFPCFVDDAAVGLVDPAHVPYVHKSRWWRSQRAIHEKVKLFGPSHLGFTMRRHKPSENSFAYKLLGGEPETEISFQLPGIRIEHIRAGRHVVVGLTCVTPVSQNETEVTHAIYTDIGVLRLFSPLARPFARRFLEQDLKILAMLQHGLNHERNLLFIPDADTQARWYHQLKNEFSRAQDENRNFANPVKETVLRWRT